MVESVASFEDWSLRWWNQSLRSKIGRFDDGISRFVRRLVASMMESVAWFKNWSLRWWNQSLRQLAYKLTLIIN
ncbi:hypothetical protein [Sporosarcina limicola]|uniref:Uncharacterized protein n=1 Tax=Sporosarcina limicola TaxID=34101 RepID=A0A927MK44_9BACL|nr:hypothetical protein [Sporosarcina limicola]MBE1555351.1 hypothetical protein [Sporosarcina limicola]